MATTHRTTAGNRVGKGENHIDNDIRSLRARAGDMTQQELADRVGVTRQTVNAIEGNKYSPSLEVAFRIARILDVPLEHVFAYDDTSMRRA